MKGALARATKAREVWQGWASVPSLILVWLCMCNNGFWSCRVQGKIKTWNLDEDRDAPSPGAGHCNTKGSCLHSVPFPGHCSLREWRHVGSECAPASLPCAYTPWCRAKQGGFKYYPELRHCGPGTCPSPHWVAGGILLQTAPCSGHLPWSQLGWNNF